MLEIIKILFDNPRLIDIERIPGLQLTEFLDKCNLEINFRQFLGNHSDDDLSYSDILQAIQKLYTTYEINPFRYYLSSVTYGISVYPKFPPSSVIENVALHKKNPFSINRKGEYVCSYQRYRILLKENGNSLRYTKKVKKMIHLKKHEILTLADLVTPKKLYRLGQDLLDSFDDFFIVEPISSTSVRKKDLIALNALKNKTQAIEHENISYRRRKRLMELVNSHSTSRIKMDVQRKIQKKINDLFEIDKQTIKELTDLLWQFSIYRDTYKKSNSTGLGDQLKTKLEQDINQKGKDFSVSEYILEKYRDEEALYGFDEIIALDNHFGINSSKFSEYQ